VSYEIEGTVREVERYDLARRIPIIELVGEFGGMVDAAALPFQQLSL
jgi:hypothetical protein